MESERSSRLERLQVGIKGKVSGHSLRRGMAQQLTAENVSLQAVADAGRWKNVNQVITYVKSDNC